MERVEGQTRPSPLKQTSRVSASPTWTAWATVTEEIAAGTWGEPGEGKATLEHNGQEVVVRNRLVDEAITVGTHLLLVWVGGDWQAFATC